MNVICFTGNLGHDAELRYTAGGDAIAGFNVALNSGYGENKTTTWMKCSLFGKRAESLAQYLTKGSTVGITGEFTLQEWTDKEGNKRSTPSVRVNDVTLLGSRDGAARGTPAATGDTKPESTAPSAFDRFDDIPF